MKANVTELKNKMQHAVTVWDKKQSTKRFYNIYALGMCFQRIDEICTDIENGADVRKAILSGFNDRLLDVVLVGVGQSKATAEETQGIGIYKPFKSVEPLTLSHKRR